MKVSINTPEALFDQITKIVATPHTTITQADRKRAAMILAAFENYLMEHTQDQEDINKPWVDIDENFYFSKWENSYEWTAHKLS